MSTVLNMRVNGEEVELFVEEQETLLDIIRDRLALTGAKRGCGEGQCGHCTVILNGKSVNSCLTLALEAQGGECLTIEGMADADSLHPVQKAFVDASAFQCGYCTPGMIMSAYDLLNNNTNADEIDIREALKGVMCRCTGYYKIIDAVGQAANEMRTEGVTDA